MKRIILSISLFLFSFTCLFAQTLYTRTDSMAITTDSVTIKVEKHIGEVQWQKSLDNSNWVNLEGKTTDSIKVASSQEAMYRAEIIDGSCSPVYSDSVSVFTNDTITKNYLCPKDLGFTLISDSAEISNGTFIYNGTDTNNNFEIGKVIIDEESGGTIRKITEIKRQGNTTVTQTQQASMEDLFQNTSFKLSTEFVTTTQNLKSASLNQIEKALTDKDGFIHPVEIIYKKVDGTKLKSISIFETQKTTQGGALYVHKDWSNLVLYSFNGSFEANNEEGVSVSYNGSAKAYIKEGYFTFDPVFKFEFEFENPDLNINNFLVNQGKITKFKFYTDRSLVDFKNVIAYESTIGFEYNKEWTLIPEMVKGSFKFIVGGVPVWIDMNIDLNASLSANFEQQGTESTGFRNQNYITIGAKYENGGWDKISEFEKIITPIVEENEQVNTSIKLSIYPNAEAKIYCVIGPTAKIGPFLEYKSTVSASNNWEQSLDLGINAKVGVSAGIFGLGISSDLIDWDLLPKYNLWKAPDKLKIVSGNNQKSTPGSTLSSPVVLKVVDSEDNPVKNSLVHFRASLGKLFKALLSSPENAELKSAMLFASAGDSTQLAVASDTTGQVTINWTLADSTAKHQLETYLMNGKDSIREDTRDTITADSESCGCDTTKFEYFTDSRDGHIYKTIKIGTQTWMAENLNIATAGSLAYPGAGPEYGRLYTWQAALNACPASWHLPSDAEWTTLTNYLGGENVAGGKLKEAGTTHWLSPNKGATNESCFTALPGGGGFCVDSDTIYYFGVYGIWWSSAGSSTHNAWHRSVDFDDSDVNRDISDKVIRYSVRCVRD